MRCPSCGNENREEARFCDSCGAGLSADPPGAEQPHEQLPPDLPAEFAGGRYRIRGFLGEGGRKRVYLADDGATDRQVALALFDTEDVDAAVGARARREAQAMRKLGDHPHVVSVLDTGEEAGNPFIVSEYMPGGDVQSLLASEGGRLEVERAVEVATDVTRALEHAHARGIVHRDLKPANVWLDDAGAARLGDFGLATTEGRARVSRGSIVGTVAYLPPEQALGEAAGPQADIYSLGALLYEMLSGQPPFPGDDAVAIISRHIHSDPVPPSSLNPDVPEALDRAVLQLLAKRGEDRPDGAGAARELLRSALVEPEASAEAPARTENPLDRLAGGAFVGRDREIEQLRGSVDAALGGAGRVALLVGEPGIGKTRAAEELATYARVRGMPVHWGRCREDDGAPAYWPWVQAIRALVRESDPVAMAWQMGAGAAAIASLVPEVAERLDIEPADLTDSEEARFRLFDSVTSYLVAVAHDRPTMIVLDDLHWADEPSLLLLKYAAAETGDSGLLICGTYRDVELGRHHPLARVLGELGGDRIALRGLDAAGIFRYIESAAGAPPAPGLAEAVEAQTDGNPFFVGEVVRLLASEGRLSGSPGSWEAAIPQGVREVVGRRLDRLSEAANDALKVAAVVGREFDEEVVVEVAEMPMGQLASAAQEAIAERLVTDLGGGRLSFSHALVRDTLYDELSEAQRARIHERVAIALERSCADGVDERLGELAHHFLSAAPRGDLAKAVDYAERAGAQDMEQLAYEDAAGLYERALDVLALMDERDEGRRLSLLLALGGAEASAGRLTDARRAFRSASEIAKGLGDRDALVGAALGIAMQSEAGKVDDDLVALLDEALETIGPGRSAERAALLSAKSQELYWVDAQGEARRLVEEAVEIAREVDVPVTLGAALHRQILFPFGLDAPAERLKIADEMLALGRRSGDREIELRAHAFRLWQMLEVGDVPAVDRELEIYAEQAEQLRMPQHIWHTYALRAMRALLDGKLELAEELTERSRREGVRAEQPLATQYYGVQMVQIRILQGRAGELIEPVRELVERFPGIPAWRGALISLAAHGDELELGRRELDRFVGSDLSAIPHDANWFTAMGLLGEAVAMLDDAERSALIYDELVPYAGRVIVVARAVSVNGPVDRVLGMLARTLGRHDEAIRHLSSALATSTRMGDRPGLALMPVETAQALLARDRLGDRERAIEALGEAIPLARAMGARWVVDRALALRLEAQGLSSVDVTTSIDDVVEAIEAERPDLRAHAAADGTVTILFSDIEDSTVLTERLGDERWLDVLRSHNAVFREQLALHDGFEVKNQGDGFMLAFPDPRRALECAIAVQRAFDERRNEVEADVALRIRMGLHTGEVIAEGRDFFGKNVILAARIAAEARGSEILVSEEMREAARELDVRFDAGRELQLKGLAGSHTIFAADWRADPAQAPGAGSRARLSDSP